MLNVSYFFYILHARLKSYISKFGAVQSLENFICINNTYQPFAETFLFWLNPARKIQSTIGYHNTLYVLYMVHVLRYSLVAIIPACHAEDLGSNPSLISTFLHFYQHTKYQVRFPPHTHLESVIFCYDTLEITGVYS